MGASIEKIVPVEKTRRERNIKGNSIENMLRKHVEQERLGNHSPNKLGYSPKKIKFSSTNYGFDGFR